MKLFLNISLLILGLLLQCIPSNELLAQGVIPGTEQYKFMHLDIDDGLSNNQVKVTLKDQQGFIWFGTSRGLNRFDGSNFKTFLYDANDSTTIPFNDVDFLFEDYDQKLWVRSQQQFTIYDPQTECFLNLNASYKNTSIPLTGLQSLYLDRSGNTWLANTNNIIYRYSNTDGSVDSICFSPRIKNNLSNKYINSVVVDSDKKLWAVSNAGEVVKINQDNKTIEKYFRLGEEMIKMENNFQLFIDSDDDLWLYSPGQDYGLFNIPKGSDKVIIYNQSSPGIRLNNNLISSVLEDHNGLIWVATDHGGINIIDKRKNTVHYIKNVPDNKYSIAQNSLTNLYLDNEGIIWAGTFKKGVCYYHKNLIKFNHFKHSSEFPNSLPFNDINCFVEDNRDNLWIGTNGEGLVYFNRQKNTFTSYKNNQNNKNSLSNDVVVTLFIDRKGILWIGTYQGGLNSFDGRTFKRYLHDPDNPNSLSDNRVWSILEDSKQNLWVGTLQGGLNLFDRKKNQFIHYKAEDINSVGANYIMSIIEDSEQNLWLGTVYGLDVLNLNNKRFQNYPPDPNTPGYLSNGNVFALHEDVRGLIWAATPQGLNVLDKAEGKFKAFTEKDGLVNSSIRSIQEDINGNIWISTLNGISKIEIINYSHLSPISHINVNIENFGILDGLQGNEFNEKSGYRTRKGELLFGGANGFNLFTPDEIEDFEPKSKIVLSNFKVFNQEVKINTPFRNRVILDKAITNKREITLKHNENVFSVEFASLNYFQADKEKFQYLLEGFSDEWISVNQDYREITFTNLDAGNYKLRIRTSIDGTTNWTEMSPPLSIKITPPFWRSNIAYFIYLVTSMMLVFIAWRIFTERQRLKFEAEQEHREAVRMQQVDALKTKFFTNISHEFRTPLSLIIAPLEKIIEKTKNEDQRNHLILIQRNAQRLLNLVNQLLDFRRLELQKVEVKRSWGDLIGFIREVSSSFEDMVESKQIKYEFTSNCENLYTKFDKNKIDRIITNLLSNALKFTPNEGEVKLTLKINQFDSPDIEILVSDTGIGIPQDQQAHIFDRFYQTGQAGTEINQGSGIGLSMVKEYVTMLGGTIELESDLNLGSRFLIKLPVQLFDKAEIEQINKEKGVDKQMEPTVSPRLETKKTSNFDESKKTIVLVEDNADFRFYLSDNLSEKYNILEAENGAIGWEIINSNLPNLVVSDVMMPEIDGVELCKKVKSGRNTKHIPVILLTAKAEAEPVIQGYKSGADGYITKPFDFRILESRIENLINSREQLRLSYQSMIGLSPEKIDINSEDEQFIKKALEVVEAKIAEASFTVEDFGMEMGMSRVSLYKKLLALTDKSPIEFIRIIRLKRAADLLSDSQLSVSEVAYQVGFNNPRYFSKYFSKQYDMLPSEYIAKNRTQKTDISKDIQNKYN